MCSKPACCYSSQAGDRVSVSDAVLVEVGTLHLPLSLELSPWLVPWVSLRCQLCGGEMEEDGWE